jgi:Protein of unknown function (DUF3500)
MTHSHKATSVSRDVANAYLASLAEEQCFAATAPIDAPELALSVWHAVVEAGLSDVTFAWAAGLRPSGAHYDAMRGRTCLLEHDNVQGEANQVHDLWRDRRQEWGWDLLAAHHAGRL